MKLAKGIEEKGPHNLLRLRRRLKKDGEEVREVMMNLWKELPRWYINQLYD
jgi:hypothetical protein